jgi:hypothetical protein
MESVYKSHHRWGSCELYSVSSRNYFGFNGTLYVLTKVELDKVLLEVEGMNPMVCADYLIEQVLVNNRFKKTTI